MDIEKKISRKEALQLGTKVILGTALVPPIFAAARNSGSASVRSVFNVMDFGAAGDGSTLDTDAIQKTIDKAAIKGNGATVLIPGGHKFLIGTITLKSNIDFHIAKDAELILSTNKQDYNEGMASITAYRADNLQISGAGHINGQSLKFMSHYDNENEWWRPKGWRPNLFYLVRCHNLRVRDISFGNAPHWGLHMLGCEDVLVDNITIKNHLDLPNCDGIDPDHCRNVEIRNCDISCGDDAIVIKATRQEEDYGPSSNIHVHDCVLETQDSGVKIGTETTQDIHDIVFERCKIKKSSRGLTIQLRDEGEVYNIDFRDITFESQYFSDPWWGRGEAISLTAIPRTLDTKVGTIHDVRIQNVKGKAENSVRINGTPESHISNVLLNHVKVKLDRWTNYPGGLFDNRPTNTYPAIETHDTPGFSIRYADNVKLEHCQVKWSKDVPDYFTHALETNDVTQLKITDFEGKAAHPDRYNAIIIQ